MAFVLGWNPMKRKNSIEFSLCIPNRLDFIFTNIVTRIRWEYLFLSIHHNHRARTCYHGKDLNSDDGNKLHG